MTESLEVDLRHGTVVGPITRCVLAEAIAPSLRSRSCVMEADTKLPSSPMLSSRSQRT